MVEVGDAVAYLRDNAVYDAVENAITSLVRERPREPKAWLAQHFREQRQTPPSLSDAEYLDQHKVKQLIDQAIIAMVEQRPKDVNEFLEQQFDEAARHDTSRQADRPNLQVSTSGTPGPPGTTSPGGNASPERRTGPQYVADDDTPPTSPGVLLRGRSFLHDWTSDLQRYFLNTEKANGCCDVYSDPSMNARVVAVKRQYDGIAVDKQEDGWLRITEGTGWVKKSDGDHYQWVPMGTEASVVASTDIPGGFKLNQRITCSSNPSREGKVLGAGATDAEKVQVRWDPTDDDMDGAVTEEEIENIEIVVTRLRNRAPTMLWDVAEALLPPQAEEHVGLPVIVFDLDETLIYARQGPLYQRAGVQELFAMLKGKAEVVIWTAGMRSYAQAILRSIDPHKVVSHCIYRHPKWHPQFASGQRKNLSHLGRPLDHTLLVENSPDSLVGDTDNSVLLNDFEGGDKNDTTIPMLFKLLKALVNDHEHTVPEFLSVSPYVDLRDLGSVDGKAGVSAYMLCENVGSPVHFEKPNGPIVFDSTVPPCLQRHAAGEDDLQDVQSEDDEEESPAQARHVDTERPAYTVHEDFATKE